MPLPGGGRLAVWVCGHSLEVEAHFDEVRLASAFGRCAITLERSLPSTVLQGCEGRSVERLVDQPVFRGRGWTVAGEGGQTAGALLFRTSRMPYQLPWA